MTIVKKDVFQRVKDGIIEREIPVRIAWEQRGAEGFQMELEEKASAMRFRVNGNNSTSVAETIKFIEVQAHTLRKQHKDNEARHAPAPRLRVGRMGTGTGTGTGWAPSSLSGGGSFFIEPMGAQGVEAMEAAAPAVPAAPMPMPVEEEQFNPGDYEGPELDDNGN